MRLKAVIANPFVYSAFPLIVFLGLAALISLAVNRKDPTNSVLPAGSRAVVAVEREATLEISTRSRDSSDNILTQTAFVRLEPGVVVRVVDDPGFFQTTKEDVEKAAKNLEKTEPDTAAAIRKQGPTRYGPTDTLAKYRNVTVVVESGKSAGASGILFRFNLKPIK